MKRIEDNLRQLRTTAAENESEFSDEIDLQKARSQLEEQRRKNEEDLNSRQQDINKRRESKEDDLILIGEFKKIIKKIFRKLRNSSRKMTREKNN